MAPNLETRGPIWDEAQLLEFDQHATVSRGYVLRNHDPEIKWQHVGNGYYEACPGRPNTETEKVDVVVSTAQSNSELSFVTTLEHETIMDSLPPSASIVDMDQLEKLAPLETRTREVIRIQPSNTATTTLSPSEISFLHLVTAWQYSTQTALSVLRRFLEGTIKRLWTRRSHGQLLLPRFHDLVRETQYHFPLFWHPEVEHMAQEQRQDFAAQRAALHLRAVREMESEGNMGGMPFSWERVEKGLKSERWIGVFKGRPDAAQTEKTA